MEYFGSFSNTLASLSCGDIFMEKYNLFDGRIFLTQNNHIFTKKAGYEHLGNMRTGVLLVWRSFIKYVEYLQKTDSFRNYKGNLLENWGLEIAQSQKQSAEKVILKNKNQTPTKKYKTFLIFYKSYSNSSRSLFS